jgi:hypothetical protein
LSGDTQIVKQQQSFIEQRVKEGKKLHQPRKEGAGPREMAKSSTCSSKAPVPWFGCVFISYMGWARGGDVGGA